MSERNLRLKVDLSAIDRASGPLKAVLGNSRGLAGAAKEARDRLRELEQQNKRLEAFRQTARDVAVTGNAMQAAQVKVRDLARQMAATDAPSKALVRNFEAAKREAAQLKERHGQLSAQQQRLRTEMQAAGVPLQGMAQHQAELRRRIADATGELQRQNAALQRQGEQMRRLATARAQYDKTLALRDKLGVAGTSMTVAGAALGAPVVNAIREYSSFEDAMLGVQRQVAGVGEVGSASYKAIAAEVKALGRELPIPINHLAEMYTAAARMDVPRKGLRDFTRTVAMMSTAFDAVPDEIAEAMGKVAANFKIPLTDIGRLADTINYLDDNAISKASDIIGVLNRTSGVASTVAITDKAVAALASTLLTLGDREESAGTAINAIIQKFAAAEKGTKGFRSAMGEIGLSLTDVQRGMQRDAQGTLFRVIEAIQRLPAEKRTGVMVELVGMEHSDTLAKLTMNTAEWRRQVELANSAAAEGSMQREFLKRTNALSAGWERFKNSMFDVNTESGFALRDSLAGIMESLGGVLNGVADWMRMNPGLTGALVKLVGVTALMVTGMGALALAMVAVIGPFAVARYGMALFGIQGGGLLTTLTGLAKGALPMLGAGIKWLTGLVIANPIGAAIAGIAVAALLIYRYWGSISAFFGGLWGEIKAAFGGGLAGIGALILNWSPLGLFYQAFAGVMGYFGIELPGKFTEFGGMLLDGLVRGITGALGKAKDAITGAGASVVGWFKDKLGIHSPSRVFAELGGFTMDGLAQGLQGGAAAPLQALGKTARTLVAAAGAGLAGMGVAMAGGAGISIDTRPPMTAPAAAGAAGGSHYEIHIHAAAGMDPQAIARAVAAELDRRDRESAARRRSRLTDDE